MAIIPNPNFYTARFVRLYALVVPLLVADGIHAQAYTPPPPPLTTAPCVPTKKDPCTPSQPAPANLPPANADKNPFPGETSAAAPADAPQPNPAKPPAAKAFPFPGEPAESSSSTSTPDAAAAPDSAPAEPSKPGLKDAGSTGSTRFQRRHLAKVEDLDKRELEDIDVSRFYVSTGNFTAAYARAQDAVRLYPDDENAHLALAVAAEKLKKRGEAVAEYKTYLKLAPDGDKAKQAQRAVASLASK